MLPPAWLPVSQTCAHILHSYPLFLHAQPAPLLTACPHLCADVKVVGCGLAPCFDLVQQEAHLALELPERRGACVKGSAAGAIGCREAARSPEAGSGALELGGGMLSGLSLANAAGRPLPRGSGTGLRQAQEPGMAFCCGLAAHLCGLQARAAGWAPMGPYFGGELTEPNVCSRAHAPLGPVLNMLGAASRMGLAIRSMTSVKHRGSTRWVVRAGAVAGAVAGAGTGAGAGWGGPARGGARLRRRVAARQQAVGGKIRAALPSVGRRRRAARGPVKGHPPAGWAARGLRILLWNAGECRGRSRGGGHTGARPA
jgi:hypothetical protein